jgi:hypothetical protein
MFKRSHKQLHDSSRLNFILSNFKGGQKFDLATEMKRQFRNMKIIETSLYELQNQCQDKFASQPIEF